MWCSSSGTKSIRELIDPGVELRSSCFYTFASGISLGFCALVLGCGGPGLAIKNHSCL